MTLIDQIIANEAREKRKTLIDEFLNLSLEKEKERQKKKMDKNHGVFSCGTISQDEKGSMYFDVL